MHPVFNERGKGKRLLVKQGKTEKGDIFGGELLSKMAGGPKRPHKFRFRRREDRSVSTDVMDGDGFS